MEIDLTLDELFCVHVGIVFAAVCPPPLPENR